MHQLVTGGFETTTSALDHGMWLLARRPDVQDRVRRDPSLVPAFVEEVLRYESCVGAALARQELLSAFTHWLDRTSSIELARPFDGPVHHPSFILFPMRELPLRFEPA
jgi:cytochrome P450